MKVVYIFKDLQDQHRKTSGTILEKDNKATKVSVKDRTLSPE